jgi:hypothetical protein
MVFKNIVLNHSKNIKKLFRFCLDVWRIWFNLI